MTSLQQAQLALVLWIFVTPKTSDIEPKPSCVRPLFNEVESRGESLARSDEHFVSL
jgi:hypothetical protein